MKLQQVKTEIQDFEVIFRSKTTQDNLIFGLDDIYNIEKSIKDGRRLYLYLDNIGAVAIVR